MSGATIRRDLGVLHGQGMIHRTRGGAVTGRVNLELPLRHRAGRQQSQKRRIGLLAAALVPDGAVVGMTGGTTVTEIARALADRRGITVVTNAVNIAADLIVRPDIRLVVVGGNGRSASYALVGPATERALSQYNLDIAFIGVDGLTPSAGCTTHDELEAHTDRAFLRSSARSVVVADNTKIGRVTFAEICPLADIDDLVTDDPLDQRQERAMTDHGVRVLRA